MLVKVKPEKRYGDFFLVFEADGDPEEKPDVRKNMKRIDLKPNNRARIDFRDGAEEPEEPLQEPGTPEAEPEPQVNNAENPEANVEAPAEDQPDTGTEEDFAADEQPPEETEVPPEEGGENPEEPQVNDAENPEANAEAPAEDQPDTGTEENFAADTGEETPAEGDTQTTDQQNTNGPGLEYDSTRQYKLFLDLNKLHNSVSNYISNLETEIRDDSKIMEIYTENIEKLKQVKDLLFDYMNLKFKNSSYIQNLLFYQKMYTTVDLIADILSETIKSNN